MDHGVFAIFGTLSLTCEPIVDEYTSRLQMPLVTISEAYGSRDHQQKIRLRPEMAPALCTLLESLKWVRGYYFYNSKEGE